MKKYTIYASETVYYMKEVEAESEKQARDMVFDGEIAFDLEDIYDGRDFEVRDIEEITQ